jgi:hypothetical protein
MVYATLLTAPSFAKTSEAGSPMGAMRCRRDHGSLHPACSSEVHWGQRLAVRGITEMQ